MGRGVTSQWGVTSSSKKGDNRGTLSQGLSKSGALCCVLVLAYHWRKMAKNTSDFFQFVHYFWLFVAVV